MRHGRRGAQGGRTAEVSPNLAGTTKRGGRDRTKEPNCQGVRNRAHEIDTNRTSKQHGIPHRPLGPGCQKRSQEMHQRRKGGRAGAQGADCRLPQNPQICVWWRKKGNPPEVRKSKVLQSPTHSTLLTFKGQDVVGGARARKKGTRGRKKPILKTQRGCRLGAEIGPHWSRSPGDRN